MSEHRPEDNEGVENVVPEQPAVEQPGAEHTQQWGQQPSASPYGESPPTAVPGAQQWGQQSGQPWGQPAQPWGQQPSQGAAPHGQQPDPYAYQPPQAQQPAQPSVQANNNPYQPQFTGQQPPYGAPYQQQPQAPWATQQPGQPWGAADPNAAPYGAPYGQVPQKKRSLTWLWILLGIVLVAVIGVIWWISTLFASPDSDRLYNQCASGDPQACEELFQTSPVGSSDERFGETCGGRTDGTISCADADMTAPANSWTGDSGDDSATAAGPAPLAIDDPNGCMVTACEEGAAFGDNSRLDNLYTACEGGEMQACDDLWLLSTVGSEYEEFGATCGDPGGALQDFWCSPETETRWQ